MFRHANSPFNRSAANGDMSAPLTLIKIFEISAVGLKVQSVKLIIEILFVSYKAELSAFLIANIFSIAQAA